MQKEQITGRFIIDDLNRLYLRRDDGYPVKRVLILGPSQGGAAGEKDACTLAEVLCVPHEVGPQPDGGIDPYDAYERVAGVLPMTDQEFFSRWEMETEFVGAINRTVTVKILGARPKEDARKKVD